MGAGIFLLVFDFPADIPAYQITQRIINMIATLGDTFRINSKLPNMKITILLLSFACILICFTNCSQSPSYESVSNNPDSVKKIIVALNDECYRTLGNPEKYQSFCEDSMLIVGDDMFMISSSALSHDLLHIYVLPHDYTFRLFGNTAVISYLWTGFDLLNGDTIFHSLRNLRTFAFNNGKWKVVSNAVGSQFKNYFKPIKDKRVKDYGSYAGVYQQSGRNFDTIFVKDSKLYDRQTGDNNAYWNFAVSDSEYMNPLNLDRVIFRKDSKGEVAYYIDRLFDGQEYKCPKIK